MIFPGKVKMEFPVIIGDESPKIYAYSLCSCVAEKFEAIVSLGYDNSRFKDFYDLYILASSYDFDGEELREAVRETFSNRGTAIKGIVAFEPGFAEDSLRQKRWEAFIKKKKALLSVTLDETLILIQKFLSPLLEAIVDDSRFPRNWLHAVLEWN